ncbi:type II toxin-antitoxin system RelE/ParE family toxin [Shinella daejeonensis]|uniref:type II toxin-antitoxin system RelE/ParE family toxin n=1 Tax=Shinella daejeonensis TaxID=659017 RepID=UPI0020C7AC27|nr:type II toxin-antitoxin system RelE/ParE family toxin [Shinella daejeonensis]MCP8894733.1 type II toxin-antitoxin system RelE/ParE family toxin [Shinella daejeonensis]
MQDQNESWLAIAKHNPQAADRVLEAIEERWKTLSRFPSSGMERNEIAPGIRHLGEGHYLTLYRVTEHSVEIVRILYGRRKMDRKIVS